MIQKTNAQNRRTQEEEKTMRCRANEEEQEGKEKGMYGSR
jgi:hypothetical protein